MRSRGYILIAESVQNLTNPRVFSDVLDYAQRSNAILLPDLNVGTPKASSNNAPNAREGDFVHEGSCGHECDEIPECINRKKNNPMFTILKNCFKTAYIVAVIFNFDRAVMV